MDPRNLVQLVKDTTLYSGELRTQFWKILENSKKFFLGNENSMIDTKRIDEYENGKVGPQSYNLDTEQGYSEIRNWIDYMKKHGGNFFPGTMLRDFGGYSLPTMPIILKGELILERIKQNGIAYIDNYNVTAKKLLGKDFEEKRKKMSQYTFAMRAVQEELRPIIEQKRKDSLKTIEIEEHSILPIICNELHEISQNYEGKPANTIFHICNNLFQTKEEREFEYNNIFKLMRDRKIIENQTLIATTELGNNPGFESFTGFFMYDQYKLHKL